MLITSTTNADSGKYTCVRSNDAGNVSGEAYLTVLGTTLHYNTSKYHFYGFCMISAYFGKSHIEINPLIRLLFDFNTCYHFLLHGNAHCLHIAAYKCIFCNLL